MIYDLIIIGLGPAGIAASIYAKRSGLNILVLESKIPGGLVNYTNVVNNYPGFINIDGPSLASKMYEHFKSLDIEYRNEDVIELCSGDVKIVKTRNNEYKSKYVIIATGRSRRSLNLRGEKKLQGRGISYCALCDGHFFKDKDIAIVGAGDSSLEEALYLSKIVKSIKIIVRGSVLTGNKELVNSVNKTDNIEVLYKKNVKELLSENEMLSGVKLDDGSILKISGLFVYIGFDPILPFKTEITFKNNKGYLITDEHFETSENGIYAAGDIINKEMYQIISAEYEGATAANDIAKKLTKKN